MRGYSVEVIAGSRLGVRDEVGSSGGGGTVGGGGSREAKYIEPELVGRHVGEAALGAFVELHGIMVTEQIERWQSLDAAGVVRVDVW